MTEQEEHHAVVKLILARYESNPDEFTDARNSRYYDWTSITDGVLAALEDGEHKESLRALRAMQKQIALDTYHRQAMRVILSDKEVPYQTVPGSRPLSQNAMRAALMPGLQKAFDDIYANNTITSITVEEDDEEETDE
jgi:hypothetical protein